MAMMILQAAGKRDGALACSDDEDVALGSELAADVRYEIARRKPEPNEEEPARNDEQAEKNTADVELGREHENKQRQRTRRDLPEGVADNHAGPDGLEFSIDVEPIAGAHPGEQTEAEKQRVNVRRQEEPQLQRRVLADAVSKSERRRCENRVGQTEYDFQLALLAAEHFLFAGNPAERRGFPSILVGSASFGKKPARYLARPL